MTLNGRERRFDRASSGIGAGIDRDVTGNLDGLRRQIRQAMRVSLACCHRRLSLGVMPKCRLKAVEKLAALP
jgi:hypothetical protein